MPTLSAPSKATTRPPLRMNSTPLPTSPIREANSDRVDGPIRPPVIPAEQHLAVLVSIRSPHPAPVLPQKPTWVSSAIPTNARSAFGPVCRNQIPAEESPPWRTRIRRATSSPPPSPAAETVSRSDPTTAGPRRHRRTRPTARPRRGFPLSRPRRGRANENPPDGPPLCTSEPSTCTVRCACAEPIPTPRLPAGSTTRRSAFAVASVKCHLPSVPADSW